MGGDRSHPLAILRPASNLKVEAKLPAACKALSQASHLVSSAYCYDYSLLLPLFLITVIGIISSSTNLPNTIITTRALGRGDGDLRSDRVGRRN